MIELLPLKATFQPGEPVEVEVRGDVHTVRLTHLGRHVAESPVIAGRACFGELPVGGYGVDADGSHSALDVLSDPLSRPRYGFVSHYEPGRDPSGVAENARRLHLNAIQFYDWMYRHAQLLPAGDTFTDALGQEVSLETVRRLAAALTGVGTLPLGYAAVYAAGADEWPAWRDEGLYHADGEPWMLADFLWIVDPSSESWLAHLAEQLRTALGLGFAGFHLDQYGAPKRALRSDRSSVDLSEALPALVDRIAVELPGARLIFNNVNDFPVWSSAAADQAAIYIEVWPPHDRLDHLASLIAKARTLDRTKPIILAAYLEPFAGGDENGIEAMRLELATVFSHGATAILHGEEDAVLTDPYYVRHARLTGASVAITTRYYDFAVRHGDVLFDRSAVDVTRSVSTGINGEIAVEAPVPVSADADAGALWIRVLRIGDGVVVHLIDLSAQENTLWNAPKRPSTLLTGVCLRLERAQRDAPFVQFAAPEDTPTLVELVPSVEPNHDVVALPPFRTWALVRITDARPAGEES